jgi:hypothetical protein
MKIEILDKLLVFFVVLIVLVGCPIFAYANPSVSKSDTIQSNPSVSKPDAVQSSPSSPAPDTGTPPLKTEVVDIKITDAKMTTGLDTQMMPIQVTDVFPRDTRQVFCWLSWSDAVPKMEMKVVWNYEIDDIKILTYDFAIPRKKGSGGISLTLPTGKVLPVGSYRVDIIAKDKVLKSLTFKVK